MDNPTEEGPPFPGGGVNLAFLNPIWELNCGASICGYSMGPFMPEVMKGINTLREVMNTISEAGAPSTRCLYAQK